MKNYPSYIRKPTTFVSPVKLPYNITELVWFDDPTGQLPDIIMALDEEQAATHGIVLFAPDGRMQFTGNVLSLNFATYQAPPPPIAQPSVVYDPHIAKVIFIARNRGIEIEVNALTTIIKKGNPHHG